MLRQISKKESIMIFHFSANHREQMSLTLALKCQRIEVTGIINSAYHMFQKWTFFSMVALLPGLEIHCVPFATYVLYLRYMMCIAGLLFKQRLNKFLFVSCIRGAFSVGHASRVSLNALLPWVSLHTYPSCLPGADSDLLSQFALHFGTIH